MSVVGFEPTHLAAADFESAKSAVPSYRHIGDSREVRTPASALKGPCLDQLDYGAIFGVPSGARTRDPVIMVAEASFELASRPCLSATGTTLSS